MHARQWGRLAGGQESKEAGRSAGQPGRSSQANEPTSQAANLVHADVSRT